MFLKIDGCGGAGFSAVEHGNILKKKPLNRFREVAHLCDPARIQTWNLLIRSQILYSVKLRGQRAAKIIIIPAGSACFQILLN